MKSSKPLFSDEPDEVFVCQKEKVEKTKTVKLEFHDFLDISEDNPSEIRSPKFTVGDISFTVSVSPMYWDTDSQDIAVFLIPLKIDNEEVEEVGFEKYITHTCTIKHASGVEMTMVDVETEMDTSCGAKEFLSQEEYKEWAKNHGDVFRIEVKITVTVERRLKWSSIRKD